MALHRLQMVVLVLIAGCSQSSFDEPLGELPPTPEGPGQDNWGKQDVSCSKTSQCTTGESCVEGVCRMTRCADGPYTSSAPIGAQHLVFADREVVAADATADGGRWVDGYAPSPGQLGYEDLSWNVGGKKVHDLDSGDLAADQERFAFARANSRAVHVQRGGSVQSMEVNFQPVAVGVGDVDLDGLDEIAAIAPGKRFALCRATDGSCLQRELHDDFRGRDVSVGDIDGDGYAEVLFLATLNGAQHVVVWNAVHYEDTGETPRLRYTFNKEFASIDTGDLDGDGTDELIALRKNTIDHKLVIHTWGGQGFQHANSVRLLPDAKDITVADLLGDERAEVLLLRKTKLVEVWRASGGPGSLGKAFSTKLGATANPSRIAIGDIDGDAPVAKQVAGPELVPGPTIPVMAMNFPPYSTRSDDTAGIFVGKTETSSESFSDSVSLSVGLEFGVEAGIEGLFSSSLKTSVSRRVQRTTGVSKTMVVGGRFSIPAKPEKHGPSYGAVMLSSGCYHAYTYKLDDPNAKLGDTGNGGRFVGMVPVGGQMTVWSTPRYNAMAKAVGTLPQIEVNTELGNPASYPLEPETVDGTPIPTSEMVFPDPPSYLVSDVGNVGWWLSSSDHESQTVAMQEEIGVSASANAAGISVGSSVSIGRGTSHGITVGEQVIFGGSVPPIEDDSGTSSDEYDGHRFNFAPYVYKEPYERADGTETSYYVLNFTVAEPM